MEILRGKNISALNTRQRKIYEKKDWLSDYVELKISISLVSKHYHFVVKNADLLVYIVLNTGRQEGICINGVCLNMLAFTHTKSCLIEPSSSPIISKLL